MTNLTQIEALLAAYNARDLRGFLATFTEDAVVMNMDTGAVEAQGLDEIRPMYAAAFGKKSIRCRILNRITLNRLVVDLEEIVDVEDSTYSKQAVVIYEVMQDGVIEIMRLSRGL